MAYTPLEKQLRRHVQTYQEYNSSTCTELFSTPSALEFHRYVASNRPLVIRGQGFRDQVPALDRWADDYLIEKMEEREVDISLDPTGCALSLFFTLKTPSEVLIRLYLSPTNRNADSIVDGHFVEPASSFSLCFSPHGRWYLHAS